METPFGDHTPSLSHASAPLSSDRENGSGRAEIQLTPHAAAAIGCRQESIDLYPASTRRCALLCGAVRIRSEPRNSCATINDETARLDARIVNLTRPQASHDVAAHGLAPSVEALDTRLAQASLLARSGSAVA